MLSPVLFLNKIYIACRLQYTSTKPTLIFLLVAASGYWSYTTVIKVSKLFFLVKNANSKQSDEIKVLKKFDFKSFKAEDPRHNVTVGQIIPLIDDIEIRDQAVQRDIRQIYKDQHKISEG